MVNLKRFRNLPTKTKIVFASILAFILLMAFWVLYSAWESVDEYLFKKQVNKLERAADVEMKRADEADAMAEHWREVRKSKYGEYKRRGQARKQVDQQAEESERELKEAKASYEKARTDFHPDSDLTLAERERRAIENARELYEQ